jgi:hypothetical protein
VDTKEVKSFDAFVKRSEIILKKIQEAEISIISSTMQEQLYTARFRRLLKSSWTIWWIFISKEYFS